MDSQSQIICTGPRDSSGSAHVLVVGQDDKISEAYARAYPDCLFYNNLQFRSGALQFYLGYRFGFDVVESLVPLRVVPVTKTSKAEAS